MSLMYVMFVAAYDLVGLFFNILMLWNCFRLSNIKNTFVQMCKILAVCHSACQVMIVVTDAVEWWQGFEKSRQSCNIFRVLSICMMILQAFNITVIMIIHSYHRIQEVSSTLKGIAALHIYSAACWWYSCLPHEVLSGLVIIAGFFSAIGFALLLFAASSRNNLHDEVKGTTPKASRPTGSLLWDFCEVVIPFFFQFCFVVYLVVIVTSSLYTSLLDIMIPSFTRFAVGIAVPTFLMELIYSGFEEEYESGKVVVM